MTSSRVSLALALVGSFGCGAAHDVKAPMQPAAPASTAVATKPPSPPSPPSAPTEPAAPTEPTAPTPTTGVLRVARSVDLGKWPEGVAVAGGVAWVADSGNRRVARVELTTTKPPTYIPVGRLPVEIAIANDGKVYALAHTDNAIWEIDPKSARGRVFATVKDCPQSMTLDATAIWVLLWQKCSSADSSVVRVDLTTRRSTTSPKTGRDAWAIAEEGGRAWVARSDAVVVVSGSDLHDVQEIAKGPRTPARRLVRGLGGVYMTAEDRVMRLDEAKREVTAEVKLGERVSGIATGAHDVVAIGASGKVWRLDPTTLERRAELTPSAPTGEPRSLAVYDDQLLVTTSTSDGGQDHGRLLVLAP